MRLLEEYSVKIEVKMLGYWKKPDIRQANGCYAFEC